VTPALPRAQSEAAPARLSLSRGDRLAWAVIAAFWLVDLLLAPRVGIAIVRPDLYVLPVCILLPSAAFYLWRGESRPFHLTHCLARFYALAVGAAVLSYIAARTPMPLADALFARADRALGFDWPAWYAVVRSHPRLETAFAVAYASMSPQTVAAVIGFALLGQRRRGDEAIWALALSIIPTLAISAVLPAEGAWAHFGFAAGDPPVSLEQFLALRADRLHMLNPADLGGIITFPSYHAVWAILVPWLLRGTPFFVPALLLDATMMAAAVSEGGHYLVDLFGGTAVAALAILIIRRCPVLTRSDPL
jgi:hypothetical protein